MVPKYPGEPRSREPVDDVFIPPSIIPQSRKIHNPKALTSYNEIFTCDGGSGEEERPTRVYLFGEVGSGKSTLISKMASDWTKQDKDSLLTTVPLLFVLDLTIMGNVSLHDAIVKQLLPEDTRFTSAQLKEFISENQSKAMIVLDGYDKSIHEHLGPDVVDVLRNERLQDVCVVVTTRKEFCDLFDDIGTYHGYQVSGFAVKGVKKYVRREFDWPHMRDAKNDLKDVLRQYDMLPGVCTNPMMLLMVCHFWKRFWNVRSRGETTTFTDFYNELLKHMYRRAYLNMRAPIMRPLETVRWRLGENRQEEKLAALVQMLGRLAFQGLHAQLSQITTQFHSDYIEREISDPTAVQAAYRMRLLVGCNDLTTMTKTTITPSSTPSVTQSDTTSSSSSSPHSPSDQTSNDIDESNPSPFAPPGSSSASSISSSAQRLRKGTITFFHESAQQKCAGEYMAKLADAGADAPANSQDRQKMESFLQGLDTVDDVLSRKLMLRFACSSSNHAARLILRRLAQIAKEEFQNSMARFHGEDLQADECRRIQDFIALCLKCNYESHAEGKYNKLLAEILCDKQLLFLGISPYTTTAVGYYLRHLDKECSVAKIKITPIPAGDGYCSVSCGAKAKVYQEYRAHVRDPEQQQSQSDTSYDESDPCRLHGRTPEDSKYHSYLRKYFEDWPSGGESNLSPIFEGLQASGEKAQLKCLDLSEIPLGKQTEKILKLIDEGCFKHLEKIHLHNVGLRKQDVRKMAVLKKLRNLQVLDLSSNTQAGSDLSVVIDNASGQQLRVLNLSRMNAPSTAMLSVVSKITEFKNLEELRLNDNCMGEECGSLLANKLQQAKQLQRLGVSVQGLEQATHAELLRVIGQLDQLRELHIHDIGFPVEFIRLLLQILTRASFMEILYCDAVDTPISSDLWRDLMRQIEEATNLKSLTLLGFRLEMEDFLELVDHCKDNDFVYLG